MFGQMLENVRTKAPLIHTITNYVTANDCANILLACGGSPIMAFDAGEVEDITTLCGGLCINIGTLDQRNVPAMLAAGRKANQLSHPAVLDPVGAGASALRTATALRLMREVRFSVIRGNISEIRALASGHGGSRGVDADMADQVTEGDLERTVRSAKAFAQRAGAVIAITGAIDIVTDGDRAFCIRNGHRDMRKVTGAGCQLSAMTAAYVTANPDDILTAAAAAVCAMGLCGQRAHARMTAADGNASYRGYIIDAVCNLTAETLEAGADYSVL